MNPAPMNTAPLNPGSPQLKAVSLFAVGLGSLFATSVGTLLCLLSVGLGAVPWLETTVVASGSMAPALRPGDVVVVKAMEIDEIGIGDIVVFDSGDHSVVHRVVASATESDGRAVLTTRGDANSVDDSAALFSASLRGKGVVVIPWVGQIRLWIDGLDWPATVGMVLALFVLIRSSGLAWYPTNDPWAGRPIQRTPTVAWIGRPVTDLQLHLLAFDVHRSLLLGPRTDADDH